MKENLTIGKIDIPKPQTASYKVKLPIVHGKQITEAEILPDMESKVTQIVAGPAEVIETDAYYESLEQVLNIEGPRLLLKGETNYIEEPALYNPQVQW